MPRPVTNYPLQIEWMCQGEDDKPVSNFYPKVLSKINVKCDDGTEVRVRMKLCFGNKSLYKSFAFSLPYIHYLFRHTL